LSGSLIGFQLFPKSKGFIVVVSFVSALSLARRAVVSNGRQRLKEWLSRADNRRVAFRRAPSRRRRWGARSLVLFAVIAVLPVEATCNFLSRSARSIFPY